MRISLARLPVAWIGIIVLAFFAIPSAAQTWSTVTPMPTPRYGLSVAVVGAKIYAIGGQYSGTTIDAVEEYDPVADAWISRAPMPTPRRHPAAAVANGKIYVIGGYSDSSGVLDTVEAYDPSTDTWATKASLPTPNYSLQAEAVNGKIYAIGGYHARDAVLKYDPITDTWTAKTPMPTPRWAFASGVVNGRIYAIGGYMDGLGVLAGVEEYNPQTDAWTTKASMPTARLGPSAAVLYSSIYVVGGENGVTLNTVEKYNAALNEWTAVPSMPTPSYALSSGALNNKVYAIGGLLYLPGGPTFLDTAQVLTVPPIVTTASIRPPIDANGGSVFNANRGVVPVKFTLALDGVSTCELPPATISLFRTAGGVVGAINESDYIHPSDDGSNFRVSDCQYVYNLGSKSLGIGTYLVHIEIDGAVVGTGTFSLR